MDDLMLRILNDKTLLEEVVLWLLSSDMAVQKEGYTKIAFARYLVDFLRKHMHLLLPKQEPCSNILDASTTKPLNTSTPLKISSQESTPQNFKSVVNTSTSFDSRSPTPASNNRSRTPFSSSCNSTTVSQNTSASSPSMELLERRLTSRENSKISPKPLQLSDFIVTKEKQQKKKKRVKPIPCTLSEMQENISITPPSERTKSGEQVPVKRITPTLCNRGNSPGTQNEPIKILKRIPLVKTDEQIQQPTPIQMNDCSNQLESSTKITEASNVNTGLKSSIDMTSLNNERKVLIQKLASLYSVVITSNYTQDLLKELNYLMSLLSIDESCSLKTEEYITLADGKKISLFDKSEEGIYFAALVLELQWNLLKQLNNATLSTLAQLLNSLVPEFAERICIYIEQRKSDSQNISIVEREMLSETVKFKMDMDCRPNYVNDQLFYAFKKQRDEFYSLLQEWEEETNKRQNSADFFKAKLKKLKSILTTSTASTNMYRLADLFVSQILASVFNETSDNKEKPSVDGITSSKFDLLNRRFVAPSSLVVRGEKRFLGVQEFFKDFLRTSSAENSFFFSHVRDVLVQRIISLNSVNISSEASVASVRQESYLVCVNKLCLLAKFLSLISFLPYQDKETLPPHLRIPLVDARRHVLPPLDFDRLLTEAIASGRILISVPWIVEFMNGIDDNSIQLPCYKILLAKLQYLLYKIRLPANDDLCEEKIFCVYTDDVRNCIIRGNDNIEENTTEKSGNRMNIAQLKKLAANTTSDFTKRFVNECLQTAECTRILITLYVNSLFNNISVSTIINMEDMAALINSPVFINSEFYIDNTALYQCFPQLNELKSVLEGRKKLSYKSITPKAEKTFCDQQTSEVALDMQLEMHFFDNMSHSVKYTVDLVAKQLSSHCVSAMRDKIIPELKTQLCEHMKTTLIEEIPMDDVTDIMLAKFYSILRRAVNEELSSLYESVEGSLKGMLKPEVKEDIRICNICVDVTCRKCIEMTYNWIFNYISFDGMVEEVKKIAVEEAARLKSIAGKVNEDKKSKKSKTDVIKNDFNAVVTPKNEVVVWTGAGPVQILHRFRHLARIVITRSNVNLSHKDAYLFHSDNDVTVDDVECLIRDAVSCIERRSDLQFIAFRRIMLMSLDITAVLAFLRPDVITNKMLQLFAKMWTYRKDCKLHLRFEHVLSCRNIEIYSRRGEREQEDVRRCISTYLHFTLENKMMHASRLFRQVLKLMQSEWPFEKLLLPILLCVKEALEDCCPFKQKILSAIGSMVAIEEEWG